jgi:hypothetical protein
VTSSGDGRVEVVGHGTVDNTSEDFDLANDTTVTLRGTQEAGASVTWAARARARRPTPAW